MSQVLDQPRPSPWQRAVRRSRSELASPLLRNAYALVANTGVTALLGLGYWVVAARLYPAEVVGFGSAVVSAMLLLSGVAQLNLMGALNRFLPVAGDAAARLVGWSYAVSAVAALGVSSGAVVAVHRWAPALSPWRAGLWPTLWFVIAVAGWSIFVLQDAALSGLRRSVWIPVENALFGATKLAMLVLLAGTGAAHAVFASWTIPVAVSLLPVNALIFGRLLPRHRQGRPTSRSPHPGVVARFVAGDYVGSLSALALTTLMPLVVTTLLGPETNAAFYAAWVIAVTIDLLASNVATSLTVEGAVDEGRLAEYLRTTARRLAVLLAPVVLGLAVAAPVVLSLFGSAYAERATTLLRVLALAAVPKAVIALGLGALRVQERVGEIAAVQLARTGLSLGTATALVPTLGLTGAGVGVLLGQGVVAAMLVPRLVDSLRSPRSAVP